MLSTAASCRAVYIFSSPSHGLKLFMSRLHLTDSVMIAFPTPSTLASVQDRFNGSTFTPKRSENCHESHAQIGGKFQFPHPPRQVSQKKSGNPPKLLPSAFSPLRASVPINPNVPPVPVNYKEPETFQAVHPPPPSLLQHLPCMYDICSIHIRVLRSPTDGSGTRHRHTQ